MKVLAYDRPSETSLHNHMYHNPILTMQPDATRQPATRLSHGSFEPVPPAPRQNCQIRRSCGHYPWWASRGKLSLGPQRCADMEPPSAYQGRTLHMANTRVSYACHAYHVLAIAHVSHHVIIFARVICEALSSLLILLPDNESFSVLTDLFYHICIQKRFSPSHFKSNLFLGGAMSGS